MKKRIPVSPTRQNYRSPKASAPGRSTTGAFGPKQAESFLAGEWTFCFMSAWVRKAKWDASSSMLWIEFDSGHVQGYACTLEMAQDFSRAPSKGGWLHDSGLAR